MTDTLKTLLVDAVCRGGAGFAFRMGGAGPRALPWAAMGRAVGAGEMNENGSGVNRCRLDWMI